MFMKTSELVTDNNLLQTFSLDSRCDASAAMKAQRNLELLPPLPDMGRTIRPTA